MADDTKHIHENKTLWVVLLTAATMIVEIIFGLTTKSMALLADGIHMGSHVLAIGLSWLAYVLVRKVSKSDNFTGNSDKYSLCLVTAAESCCFYLRW